jgi:hypothetical protein
MPVPVVKTPVGTLSFPHLFKPKAPAEGAEPRYSINLIFDKAAQATPEYKALKDAIKVAIREKWGSRADDPKFLKSLMNPVRDCAEKDGTSGYDVDDGVFIGPWTKSPPGVVDAKVNFLTQDDVWAGQTARATVKPFAFDKAGKRGVGLALNNVQIVNTKGKRLDGRRSAESEFDELDDGDTGGAPASDDREDDDIPF